MSEAKKGNKNHLGHKGNDASRLKMSESWHKRTDLVRGTKGKFIKRTVDPVGEP